VLWLKNKMLEIINHLKHCVSQYPDLA
jgi:hypothetical protein